MFAIEIVGAVLLADFLSGIVHWLEDAYARPGMPFVNKIAQENLLHHVRPREFLKKNWWQSSWDLTLIGMMVIVLAWRWKLLNLPVWVFVLCSVNANQFHKWAHQNARENGRLVASLQNCKLLLTQRHHARHHKGDKKTHYCTVTNLFNPVLDKLAFWNRMEWLLSKLLGWQRKSEPILTRPGDSNSNNAV